MSAAAVQHRLPLDGGTTVRVSGETLAILRAYADELELPDLETAFERLVLTAQRRRRALSDYNKKKSAGPSARRSDDASRRSSGTRGPGEREAGADSAGSVAAASRKRTPSTRGPCAACGKPVGADDLCRRKACDIGRFHLSEDAKR